MKRVALVLLVLLSAAAARSEILVESGGDIDLLDAANGVRTPISDLSVDVTAMEMTPQRVLYIVYNGNSFGRLGGQLNVVAQISGAVGDIRALRWVNNKMLAIKNEATDRLVEISLSTGAVTSIGLMGFADMEALALGPNGVLYGLDTARGLVTVNTTTGVATDVNPAVAGVPLREIYFDREGVLYGIHVTGQLRYRINTSTGSMTGAGGTLGHVDRVTPIPARYRLNGLSNSAGQVDIDATLCQSTIWNGPFGSVEGGAMAPDGQLHFVRGNGQFFSLDCGNNRFVNRGTTGFPMTALAFRNGVLYGIRDVAGNDQLYILGLPYLETITPVGPTGFANIVGLACDPTGQLYAWDMSAGLLRVNHTTGAATDVGASTGSSNTQSLDFAPDGTLFGTGTGVYQIDTATGIAYVIGNANVTQLHAFGVVPDNSVMYGAASTGQIWTINPNNGSGSVLGNLGFTANAAATAPDGTVYIANSVGQIIQMNRTTGAGTVFRTDAGFSWRGLAFVGGKMYGIRDGVPDKLYEISTTTPAITLLGDLPNSGLQSLAGSPEGWLYATDVVAGRMYRISPTLPSLFMDVGPTPTSMQSVEFISDGRLFGGQNNWYRLDPATGASTTLATAGFPNLRGLAYAPVQTTLNITLEDYPFGVQEGQPVTIEISHPGGPPIETISTVIGPAGATTFASTLPGTYEVKVKSGHWLRQSLIEVPLGYSWPNAYSLKNGDLVQDNVVDSDDFDVLVTAFGISSAGDLDGDGSTTSDDFDIIVRNFGLNGD